MSATLLSLIEDLTGLVLAVAALVAAFKGGKVLHTRHKAKKAAKRAAQQDTTHVEP